MAFTNLPANLKDMFYSLSDRIAKLETGPNQAMYAATSAQGTSSQALADAAQALVEANAAYALGSQALIKDSNTIVNSSNNLTGINGNGITVYSGASSTSGARVILNSAGLTGFNSSGTATFAIAASTGAVSTQGAIFTNSSISGGSLNINGNAIINSSGYLTAQGATITGNLYSAQGSIGGWTIGAQALLTGTSRIDSYTGDATFAGDMLAYSVTGYTGGTFGTAGGDSLFSSGSSGTNYLYNYGKSDLTGLVYSLGIAATVNSGAANMRIASGSTLLGVTSSSSQRYKRDITDLINIPELDPKKLYDLPVRAFKFNIGYLSADDDRNDTFVPGFIAEEVDAIYPIAADYGNGQVESWDDRIILPAMMQLIQDQNKRITELENKLNNP
jgi:hypothetical protein